MAFRERIALWLRPLAFLGRNPLTLFGAALTTSSAVTLIGFWIFDVLGGGAVHPYLGLIFYLGLPALFVIGLLLMPIGILWRRHQLVAAGQLPEVYPKADFTVSTVRQTFGWAAGLTFLNVILISVATYQGVSYMDSVSFCGQTCHVVMQPEFTAYQSSPHQRVACVQCHIGPGAGWFARSKLSGLRQVYAVTFHTYDTPIPTPVQQLRPARETCEQCHDPLMFTGDKLVVRVRYSDDEKNTPLTTVLLMKIGGQGPGGSVGIHGRHLDIRYPIQYISTDAHRQVVAAVSYTDDSGKAGQFIATDTKPTDAQLAAGEHRVMDCVDCHNRPAHSLELPERAVDEEMAGGRIGTNLPFIKKKAVEVLKTSYPTADAAASGISSALNDYYRTTYPDIYSKQRGLVDSAVRAVQGVYSRNVFPAMKVTWGTYPNNLGHTDFPGCFRCHDGNHTTADGRTIPNDCDTCHALLAADDPNPKILSDLGMK